MVQANNNAAPGRIPGMRTDLRRLYEAMRTIGASGAGSGRPVDRLSRDLHISKNRLTDALEELEGKGVVGHQTSGRETVWFTSR